MLGSQLLEKLLTFFFFQLIASMSNLLAFGVCFGLDYQWGREGQE